jgi:hypothetical protein
MLDEFFRCAKRLAAPKSSAASALLPGWQGSGLMVRITDAPTTVDKLGTAFRPDPDWISASAALREDADAPLPGLAEDDVVDSKQVAA